MGATVVAGEGADILPGNCLPLKAIPAGTMIHNIELRHGKGGQMVRSAGGAAQLVAKEGDYAQVKLPSGEVRKVARRLPGHHRPGRQHRAQERLLRQGGPQALAGHASPTTAACP